MKHKLVDFVSGNVHLAKSKLVVVFVIQYIHQVCIEWMNILPSKYISHVISVQLQYLYT